MTTSQSIVDDVRIEGGPEAYVVRPAEGAAGPGVVFLHWFDEAPNANRSQFLEEASRLAESGVASVLPQLSFPWSHPPVDAEADLKRINAELDSLRAAHAHLLGIGGVDETRVAFVGHDFGAMHGALLLDELAAHSAVMVAPTPRWSDWFLPFWEIAFDRYDYMRALEPLDPITAIRDVGCPVLFQFGLADFYIAQMTANEFFRAAGEPKTLKTYQAGHDMEMDEIRADRLAFLAETLGFDA